MVPVVPVFVTFDATTHQNHIEPIEISKQKNILYISVKNPLLKNTTNMETEMSKTST